MDDSTADVEPSQPILAREEDLPALQRLDAAITGGFGLLGPEGEPFPEPVCRLVRRMVRELARGRAVALMSVDRELTTQEAADLLNVSRPFLMKLLESGALPYRYVGTHRRVRFTDLIAYKDQRRQEQRELLDQMTREAQEMGLYD